MFSNYLTRNQNQLVYNGSKRKHESHRRRSSSDNCTGQYSSLLYCSLAAVQICLHHRMKKLELHYVKDDQSYSTITYSLVSRYFITRHDLSDIFLGLIVYGDVFNGGR